MTKEEFRAWLSKHKIGIRQLSKILSVSEDMLYKYKTDGGTEIPKRFKYTLDGVLAERIKKDKERLDNDN